MMHWRRALVLGLVFSAVGLGAAPPARAGLLTGYNVVTIGDFTTNSHVDFNTFVGGNLKGNGAEFANHSFANPVGLSVVGSVSGNTIKVNGGKNLEMTNLAQGGNLLLMNGGSKVENAGLVATAALLTQEMIDASTGFKALTTGSLNTVIKANNGQLTFTVGEIDALGRAIFSVDGSIFSNINYQNGFSIAGDFAAASSIIVNVSGTTINHTHGQFNGVWNGQGVIAKTLWNFWEAETINLNKNFNGAILAPNAHLTKSSVSTDGSIWVKSLVSQGETHSPYYTGFMPATNSAQVVPEPSTIVLGAIGAVAIGAVRLIRRRRA